MIKTIISILIFIAIPFTLLASDIYITEIMYDAEGSDANKEWIEVYNNSGSDVDFSKYKFHENDTAHKLTAFSGDGVLKNKSFAIIAENATTFNSLYPNIDTNILFDSSFSLLNGSGELLKIIDQDGNVVSEITYDPSIGGNGDGNTLQLFENVWIVSTGTPGAQNSSTANNNNNSENPPPTEETNSSSSSSSSSTSQTTGASAPKERAMQFTIEGPKDTLVGLKNSFKGRLYSTTGEPINSGKFLWNFGDGTTIEINFLNSELSHTYIYPGTYIVTSAYKYPWIDKTVILAKTVINVSDSPFKFEGFYEKPFPAVRILNSKNTEYNMFGYIIKNNLNKFVIPENTYIGGKDEIVIRLPNLVYDKNSFELLDPYENVVAKLETKQQTNTQTINTVSEFSVLDQNYYNQKLSEVIDMSDITTSPNDTEELDQMSSLESDEYKTFDKIKPYIILTLSIMFFSYLFYLLNKRPIKKEDLEDDFILYEE